MRITILTQIYRPEMGALANRIHPLVREFAAAGHKVKIATGMPNYPGGKVFPGYRRRFLMREEHEGCEVIRTTYYTVPRNQSKLTQLLSYLSFMPAVFLSALRAGRADVVFVTSPPVFPMIPAIILAKLLRARLVLDIRDLWSDELVTYTQGGRKTLPIRFIRFLERCGYRTADLICATTQSLIETVVHRGADKKATFLLPNGADLEIFKPGPANRSIRERFGLGDRFVVVYSGLFGIKHGLEVFLESARLLRDMSDMVFFLIGNGARRDELQTFVRENNLENVIIAGEQPIEGIPGLLACCDVGYAASRPESYPKKLISVKIFEYMACELPVIGAFEGESAKVIDDSCGGFVVTPGDAEGIVRAIVSLRENPALRRSMGIKGRKYVEEHYSRSDWARRFERVLAERFDPELVEASVACKVETNIHGA